MNVGIYARVSTDEQAREGYSIAAQLHTLNAWAVVKGATSVTEYVDEGFSAKNMRRPNVQRLLADCMAGRIDMVIVWKLDRLSRNLRDLLVTIEDIFNPNHVELVSATEQIDTATPAGRLMLNILGSMSQNERENTSQRVIATMNDLARQARHLGGKPLYGYSITSDGFYTVNPSEADAVRKAFELKLSGMGYGHIISMLTTSGHLTRSGKPFSKNTLCDMFRNPRYKGTYIYNRAEAKRRSGARNNRASKSESEIIRIEGGVPAIVSREVWEGVQNIMRGNNRSGGRAHAKHVYILSGLIFCGCCNAPMPVKNMGRNRDGSYRRAYYCPNHCQAPIPFAIADTAIVDYIAHVAQHGDLMERAISIAKNFDAMQKSDAEELIEFERAEIAKLEAKRSNLIDYVAKVGATAGAVFASEAQKITNDIDEGQKKIAQLLAQKGDIDLDQIRTRVREMTDIKNATAEVQKIRINQVVKQVIAYPDRFDIALRTTTAGDPSSMHAVVVILTLGR